LATWNARIPLLLTLALGGCEVTPEKIAAWKDTQKGPDKLREAVGSSSVKPEMRGTALAALVEIGNIAEGDEALKASAEKERADVVHAAVPLLVKLAQGDAAGDHTTRKQRNGKDALFQYRPYASAADRETIDDALIAWTTYDLAARASEGGHSSEKIIGAVGARAGPRLVELLGDPRSSDGSRMLAAQLLGKIGDAQAREQGGVKLIERARKEKTPSEATLQQIGLVGGDHAVAYLTQLAESAGASEKARQKALYALAQGSDPAALPAALRIAGDARAPGGVRDAAFEVAEKIGSPSVPGLIKLIGDKDEKVRWRAIEAAFKAGRDKAVAPALEALPVSASYPREDVRAFIVHDLELIGPSTLPPLRDELKSKSWVARIAAVQAIGAIGKAGDAASLDALAGDGVKLKGEGWGGATVGTEAKALARSLAGKR